METESVYTYQTRECFACDKFAKKKKYSQTCVQRSPLGNGKETIIYRVTTTIPVNIAEYKATENLGNLSGDCNIQGDRYIQV